ncbi:unnamed protein product [Soboliphyme baturini]|uniref:Uncharacterized protein n=1 Tax=Soboliphyme baturini TaxID=241478 RepID=A0A183J9C8_9BILA|nr:unnamed protein product [Soboliphyme baturini]
MAYFQGPFSGSRALGACCICSELMQSDHGEIQLSLCYSKWSSQLTVMVVQAKHLPMSQCLVAAGTRLKDPYVRLWVVQSACPSPTKKTKVSDFGEINANDEIGHIAFGSHVLDKNARAHWQEMMASNSTVTTKWHRLH